MSHHVPRKMWDGIRYPFPKFNGATVEVWERIRNFIPHGDYLSMLELKLIHVNKGGPYRFQALEQTGGGLVKWYALALMEQHRNGWLTYIWHTIYRLAA